MIYWSSSAPTPTATIGNSHAPYAKSNVTGNVSFVDNEVSYTTASTLVDENGFTFTSPSVYLVFSTLYASDLCGYIGKTYSASSVEVVIILT